MARFEKQQEETNNERSRPTEFRDAITERIMSDRAAPNNLKLKMEYFNEALDPNDNARLGERVRSLPGVKKETDALNNPEYKKYLESASTVYEVMVKNEQDYTKIEAFVDLCQAENVTLESLIEVLGPELPEEEYTKILESINTVRGFAPELLTNKPDEYILEKEVTLANGQVVKMGGGYGALHRLNPDAGSEYKYGHEEFENAKTDSVNSELSAAEEADAGGNEPTPEELTAGNEPPTESIDTIAPEIQTPTEPESEKTSEQQTPTQLEAPKVEASEELQETSKKLQSNISQRKSSLNIKPGNKFSERTGEAIPPEPNPSTMSPAEYEQAAQNYLEFLGREEAAAAEKRSEDQQRRAQEKARQDAQRKAGNNPRATQSTIIGGSITRTNPATGETETITAPPEMAIELGRDGKFKGFVPRKETGLDKAFPKGKETNATSQRDRDERQANKLRNMLNAAYELDTEEPKSSSNSEQEYPIQQEIADYKAASAGLDALSAARRARYQAAETPQVETLENTPEV